MKPSIIVNSSLEKIGACRVMEDFQHTVLTKLDVYPELWQLQRLGGDLLHASPSDDQGFFVQNNEDVWQIAASKPAVRVYDIPFPATLAAICLGRQDLFRLSEINATWSWEDALRWLIFYGFREHAMWRYATREFIRNMRRPGPLGLSPLQAIILIEREDVLRDCRLEGGRVQPELIDLWLINNGVREYGLFWILTPSELQLALENDPLDGTGLLPKGSSNYEINTAAPYRTEFSRKNLKLVFSVAHLVCGSKAINLSNGSALLAFSVKQPALVQGEIVIKYGDLEWSRSSHTMSAKGFFGVLPSNCIPAGGAELTISIGDAVRDKASKVMPSEIIDNPEIGVLSIDIARLDSLV